MKLLNKLQKYPPALISRGLIYVSLFLYIYFNILGQINQPPVSRDRRSARAASPGLTSEGYDGKNSATQAQEENQFLDLGVDLGGWF